MNMTKRRIAVTVGAAVLVAGVVAGRERPALELMQQPATARAAAKDDIDLTRLERSTGAPPQVDPFSKKQFVAEKAQAPSAAKPQAPPLPFQFFGRITENGKTDVFVMRGEELLAVAPGRTLGEYRVDSIGASSIAFTYLPLKTRQTLEIQ